MASLAAREQWTCCRNLSAGKLEAGIDPARADGGDVRFVDLWIGVKRTSD